MAYLDHAASSPVRAEVVAAMEPFAADCFANPSGLHAPARAARRALDDARERLAAAVGCHPGEVVFTSGGTEADNLAVTGTLLQAVASGRPSPTALASAVEHPAVLEPLRFLGGIELPVDGNGVVDLGLADAVLAVESDRVALCSLMLANNETGVVQPLAAFAELVREHAPGALVHTDAVQALRWLDLAVEAAPADLVSLSGHKVGGPKGIGALVVRGEGRMRLAPVVRGGPQEHELRAGTQNVAGAVGLALAAELAAAERVAASERVARLGLALLDGIRQAVPSALPAVQGVARLGAIVNLGFPGIDGSELLFLLDGAGVAASAGSACASGAPEPSPVLLAMGRSAAEARSHVRFSLAPTTTEAEIAEAVAAVATAVAALSR